MTIRNRKKKQLEEALEQENWVKGDLPLQLSYLELLESIEANATKIDLHYRTDFMSKDCSLETLFKMLDPKIFNFILMITASKEETKQLLKSPNLGRYIRGEIMCMEVYSEKRHTTFIRRVFLCVELIFLRVRGRNLNPLSFQVQLEVYI